MSSQRRRRKLDFCATRGLVAVKAIMTIRSFDLLQPRSLAEASDLLLKHGDEARPIAGGTTLVILMKQRALHYPYLVDLQGFPGSIRSRRRRTAFASVRWSRIGASSFRRLCGTHFRLSQTHSALSAMCG